MERRRNTKSRVRKSEPMENPNVLERLSSIEAHLENIEANQEQFHEMRDEFIVLKARWGIVAGVIGAMFAGLVHIVTSIVGIIPNFGGN